MIFFNFQGQILKQLHIRNGWTEYWCCLFNTALYKTPAGFLWHTNDECLYNDVRNLNCLFFSCVHTEFLLIHYNDVIISMMASQITSLTIVYSTFFSGTDQRKTQSYALLAFVRGIHWWPVNFQHKGPVMRKMFPLDDISCIWYSLVLRSPVYHVREQDTLKTLQRISTSWSFNFKLRPILHVIKLCL